ncbi:hypothetical protein [Geobacter sp. AOG1]|uniref:hypothetical protein n=1 Tax=Geobacter sp. AOG1 TaxID=1566346 RepID=UPI001CC4983C|nr:hypothetical protein [Geobacter sp. AOG1]GFE57244.1 hypothetical protein AOG1_11240 [Geobacter sp. AOG1]
MDFLSAMMLVITVILLSLSFPRIYGDWLSFQNHLEMGEREPLRELLADKKLWMHRHFCFAVLALVMAKVVEGTPLAEGAPRLSQVTAVYAVISLMLAFVESLFAQKITALLAGAQESRRNDSDYP